ncbi:hypothetical protein BGZ63DRAFT_397566 [Mariannaea sp. PMI_226]|nr:hypothetical protein BGZ63DRAFT_397566 [Mariannaea sp. PMI_226]
MTSLELKAFPSKRLNFVPSCDIPYRSGNRILAQASDCTRHKRPNQPETRGRKKKLSKADLDQLEYFYEDEGFEAKRVPWASVAAEAGTNTDISIRTVQRAAQIRDLYKRLAQQGKYKTQEEANRRLNWAEKALQ